MVLTFRCRVATNVSDYVTAVKVSDASMKCSTHAEAAVVGIASNVYEQLPLRVTYRTTRISLRETNGTNFYATETHHDLYTVS